MDLVFEQVTKEVCFSSPHAQHDTDHNHLLMLMLWSLCLWRAQHITDRGKLTSLLQKEFAASRDSERKLDLGLLLTDVLINQVSYHFHLPRGMLSCSLH
jgi:hypothetical protein